ncbi:hypothetical protein ABFS82_06G108800 [Erythranthe guttata]|uniref:uncharacterized protein LOC105977678 isoform X2 n=1 Tax=Erythranthe guttata TaxID=4155 RepID=UPI00064D8E97|nr:PREDICTED: uncharacterized protein LOC105977678 isoform X2 [Erythranthe guttata]|eukprot:XP_012858476.1 PREDICTED: uncharacterized protein LOC105977678 isoform X2 [Erythranthe guttata]
MNALTATTTFCPSSFQLKLALGSRKYPSTFVYTRSLKVGRRSVNFVPVVVRSSAVNGKGLEKRSSGNSSWSNLNSSADDFSGWSNADSEPNSGDPKPKQSLIGILGAGAVGIVLVAGLTFAALSISNRGKSRVKELEPLTTEQEKSLSSDNNQNQVEEEKNGDKDEKLENGSEESQTATQRESADSNSLVSSEATEKPPVSDITGGSLASENPSEPGEETGAIILEPSVFDANIENLVTDHPNGVSSLEAWEDSNLLLNPSSVENSNLNTSVAAELEAVSGSSIIQEEILESGSVLSTRDDEGTVEILNMDVDLSKVLEVSVSTGAPPLPEEAYQSRNEHLEKDYNDIKVSQSFFDSTNPGKYFTSAGIPAPSVVSAALQAPPGKVLVPAVIDQLQSQALSALQVLKVIEEDVQPGDLCTRREYARWLVLASSALSRNTTSKVYPAMYIENISELAFDDITPEDPDFPSIQGLAEAGLIASKLSRSDMQSYDNEDSSPIYFSPESPLSRQDLVSWKMALEKRQLPVVDGKILQQVSGFIDIEKIDPGAWPALVADLEAGDQGIITLAFGYTRLFQPEKPVTKAQAAIALSTGDSSVIVSEELARIEAESMAEKAVSAHSALVAQVEKDLNASYEKDLFLEREKINAVEKLAEEARREVEKLRAEREEESLSLMKERAAVDSKMEVFSKLRREMEEQLQTLMTDKLEISYEKERMNKLRRDAETENQEITRLQYELEVERKALSMARSWAEDEAKRAREQAKALDEARDRWERQGLKVVVDSDLREEEAEAEATWLSAGQKFSVEETIERSESLVDKLKKMADEVRGKCKVTITKIIERIVVFVTSLKEKTGELKDVAKLKLDKSVQGFQHKSAELTSSVKEGVKRAAGDWKEGVERLSQKFKT